MHCPPDEYGQVQADGEGAGGPEASEAAQKHPRREDQGAPEPDL